MNNQNLKKGESCYRGRAGGIASGIAKRKRKAMQETLKVLLSMPIGKGKTIDIDTVQSLVALEYANVTVQEAIMHQQIRKAMDGDTRVADFIRDTLGEKHLKRLIL